MSLHSRLLAAVQPWKCASEWHVAFSGGLDSTVLLHLLVALRRTCPLPPIRAVHIHHGLQAVADDWPAHCAEVCKAFGVALDVLCVEVEAGASLENKARQARYCALAAHLPVGGALLTAQHRDDQAETLLFRLFRGAGVGGLAGMPCERPLGAGRLVRPLLGCGRDELERYASEQGLHWVEDPSNRCLEHSRNYIRQRLLPLIEARWPQAAVSISRAAQYCHEAQQLLDELADMDLQAARTPPRHAWLPVPSLDLQAIRPLSPSRQRNALRRWLRDFTGLPDSHHWAGWEALRDAAADAAPIWRLGEGELHRGDNRIWWLAGAWLTPPGATGLALSAEAELPLPDNGVVLGPPSKGAALEIRYRVGGERLDLPGRGRRDLKRLLNEAGLPGFVRSRLPLLYCNNELVAVANLTQFDTKGMSLIWIPPAIPGLS